MNERQWELYRLSVVETWAESPYKGAVSAAIEHKLIILGQHTAAGTNLQIPSHRSRIKPYIRFQGPSQAKARTPLKKPSKEGTSSMDKCVDCGATARVYQNGILLCLHCLNSRDTAMPVMRPEKKKAESEPNSKPPTPGTQI